MASWMFSGAFVFNKTISADTLNYNLRDDAIAAGWDGVKPLDATVTIASDIVVYANNTANYAFDTGTTFPTGSKLTLVNNGYIIGMGGAGGSGLTPQGVGSAAGIGGPALRAQYPLAVTNYGTVGGGGGGGGGISYGSQVVGGGGGRSGRTNAPAGATSTVWPNFFATDGTFLAPGIGVNMNPGQDYGGNGGDWGTSGTKGKTTYGDSPVMVGGAAGAAVVGNSFITWLATGTLLGALT